MLETVVAILLGLVVVLALACLFFLYVRFRDSEAKRWRNRVMALAAAVEARAQGERRTLRELNLEFEVKQDELRDRAFLASLKRISVADLDTYPGIGPATIAKLREAGYKDLASLRDNPPHVPGIGEKRLTDISRAVHELLKRARLDFEQGASAESRQLQRQLEALTDQQEEQAVHARARLDAAETVGRAIRERVALARQVTFAQYLASFGHFRLPPEALSDPLPDLPVAVHAAERAADKREVVHPARPPLATLVPPPPAPAVEPTLREALEIDAAQPLTAALVRRQYHLLWERNDPEKLQAHGPEFVALARGKRERVRAAAVELMKPFGEPLELPAAPAAPQDLRHNPLLDDLMGG